MPLASSPVTVSIGDTTVRLKVGPGVHPLGPGTVEMAKHLAFRSQDSVLDLGCGHGLFSVLAARAGAARVVGTDIDAAAVACARENARLNGVPGAEFRTGDLFDPVRGERFDVIVTNPPQTPAPENFAPDKWGGPDGTRYLQTIMEQAPSYLAPGGRLYLMVISLAHPEGILGIFRERFEVHELARMKRTFTPEEYEGYRPGLFGYLEQLKSRGRARFEREDEKYFFEIYFLKGSLRA